MLRTVLFLFLFFCFSALGQAEETPESSMVSIYQNVLRVAEKQLRTEYSLENNRLDQLQSLLERGHASWLETRKQQLKVDQLEAKTKAFADFVSKVATYSEQNNAPKRSELVQLATAVMRYSGLMIQAQSKSKADESRLHELISGLTEDLVRRRAARDKFVSETNSLNPTDPWKKSFELRLSQATAEVDLIDSRLALIESLARVTSGQPFDLPAKNTVTAQANWLGLEHIDLVKSASKQCNLFGELIEFSLANERERLANLVELQNKGVASNRDIEIIKQQIERLSNELQSQQSVSAYLDSRSLQRHVSVDNSREEKNVQSNGTGKLNGWNQVRMVFAQFETSYQLESAELKKEMLSEVLARLENPAKTSRPVDPIQENSIGSALAKVRQQELAGYRRQIQFENLKIAVVKAKLETIVSGLESSDLVLAETEANSPALITTLSATLSAVGHSLFGGVMVWPSGIAKSEPPALKAANNFVQLDILGYFPSSFREFGSV